MKIFIKSIIVLTLFGIFIIGMFYIIPFAIEGNGKAFATVLIILLTVIIAMALDYIRNNI